MVEIGLKEIREVSAAYSTVTPISNPASASAAPQTSAGVVQAAPSDTSTLAAVMKTIGAQ